jgi:ABC-type branched-subunit amino acid transport system substrate-binding protein
MTLHPSLRLLLVLFLFLPWLSACNKSEPPFLTSIRGKAAPDYHPGYFRTAPNEEYSGKTAAVFAYQKLGIRKAAVINDGDIYTRGLIDGFI